MLFSTLASQFLRQFYQTSSSPFSERKRRIEAEEEPFVQPYSEDGEPAFLTEWLEADDSLHVLAYSCISMLAATLHLYFETWVKKRRLPINKELLKTVFRKKGGWQLIKSILCSHDIKLISMKHQ